MHNIRSEEDVELQRRTKTRWLSQNGAKDTQDSDAKPSVLVTGSSGTIGTALVNRLLSEGYDVFGADITENRWLELVDKRTHVVDLCNEAELDQLPTDLAMVVHLGAHARVHELVQQPELAQENIEMTFNLLEFARVNDIPRFLFASSREVYGNRNQLVHEESETRSDLSESPYTASKISGEALVRSFESCYDISTSILRFSNVYGRFDDSDRVIPLFIAQSTNGEDLTVYGADKVLDFTYLDDCVEGVVRVIEQFSKASGTTLNIASGEGYSLLELAEAIDERTPNTSEIRVEPSRNGEVKQFVADISKVSKLLGYSPAYSLADGLTETVDWYLDRPELVRSITAEELEA